MRIANSRQLQKLYNLAKELYDGLRATERSSNNEPLFSSARDRYVKLKRAKVYTEEFYRFTEFDKEIMLAHTRVGYAIYSTQEILGMKYTKIFDKYDFDEVKNTFTGEFYTKEGKPTLNYKEAQQWFIDAVYTFIGRRVSPNLRGELW